MALARARLAMEEADAGPAPMQGGDAGALSAAAGGLVEGLPIIGPVIKGGVDRGVAGLRAMTGEGDYASELARVQEASRRTQEAHPIATGAGNVAGAVAGTVPMVMAAPAAFGAGSAPLAVRSVASALSGAGLGGADAAVRSGGDLEAAKEGAMWGAGLGGLGPGVGAGVGQVARALMNKVRPGATAPSVKELKAGATNLYDEAEASGVSATKPQTADLAADMHTIATEEGLISPTGRVSEAYPKASEALRLFDDYAQGEMTVPQMQTVRKVLTDAASNPDGAERRIASIMLRRFDDFVDPLAPPLAEARGLWSQASKSEMVAKALKKAERRTETSGTGGNVDNAIRQNFRAILDNPKKLRGFSDQEIEAMERVVRGSFGRNALRQVGRMSPTTGGLSAMLNLGATVMNPAMAGFGGVGLVAKTLADRGTKAGVRNLDEMIRSGGNIPQSPEALLARQRTEELVRLLMSSSPLVANQLQPVQ